MYSFPILVPLHLVGFHEFNLNVMKEVKVTNDFLGLDKSIQGCEMEKSFDNCTTLKMIENIKKECKCLPFNIRIGTKVSYTYSQQTFSYNI